ncbi:MAG: hypothetical protein M1600_12975 [Firmicutes bacterium]|nr:hypothetical protein [Bacillota bacterium]
MSTVVRTVNGVPIRPNSAPMRYGYWAIGLLGYWAIGLLGYWVLQRHDLVWQTLVRNQAAFRGAVRR